MKNKDIWEDSNCASVFIKLQVPLDYVDEFRESWKINYTQSLIEHARIESAIMEMPARPPDTIELECH